MKPSITLKSTLSLFLALFILVLVLIPGPKELHAATAPDLLSYNKNLLELSGQYQKASSIQKSQLATKITSLIAERQTAMSAAAKADPEKVLLAVFPDKIKKTISTTFANKLEQTVSLQGKLIITHGHTDKDGFTYYQFTDSKTGTTYDLQFTNKINLPALTISGSTVKITALRIGYTLLVTDASKQIIVTAKPRSNTARTTSTLSVPYNQLGEHRLAVILVNFNNTTPSFTPAEANSFVFTNPDSIRNYYSEQSYGKETFAGDVLGWYTINYASQCTSNVGSFASAADAAALAGGVDTSAYDVRLYIFNLNCGLGFGSVANAYVYTTTLSAPSWKSMSHELGHAISVSHSEMINCQTRQIGNYADPDCSLQYYGDGFSNMGILVNGAYVYDKFQFTAPQKEFKKWLTVDTVGTSQYSTASDPTVVLANQSGTYILYYYEKKGSGTQCDSACGGGGTKALKIPKSNGTANWNDYLYVEYRQPVGFDSNLPSGVTSGVLVHSGSQESILYDSTPGDTMNSNAALTDGATFTDPSIGLTIKQLSHDRRSAMVSVVFDPTVCIKNSPSMTVAPTPGESYGSPAIYTVTVTNTDDIRCGSTTFTLGSVLLSGWTASFSSPSVTLSPGQTAAVTAYVTPPIGTADNIQNGYPVEITATDTPTHKGTTGTFYQKVRYYMTVDTTPPTVAEYIRFNGIVYGGAATVTVGGTITIGANASDNVGVTHVDFLRNGTVFNTDPTPLYEVLFDTTTIPDGLYIFRAKAYDGAGNIAQSDMNVQVNNSQDIIAPSVVIFDPVTGTTVPRGTTTTIQATASDNVGVTKVIFDVFNGSNTVSQCTDLAAPYTCAWPVPNTPNRTYTLTARAYDAANNMTTSSAVVVTSI